MPQFRLPVRDTEGLPSAVVDNNTNTSYSVGTLEPLTVNYSTPKHIYAIIIVGDYPLGEAIDVEISPDGNSFTSARDTFNYSFMREVQNSVYVWVNKSIKAWRIVNRLSSTITIKEIIVLTPHESNPLLPILYPDSVELVDEGTTNLDSFANLSNIVDSDDNTYATFAFQPGYTTYTLYLRGRVSLPLISLISPFAILEVDPGDSNLPSVMHQDQKTHAYFLWGTVDSGEGWSSDQYYSSSIPRISNSPQLLWSQKIWELMSGSYIAGSAYSTYLLPTYYSEGPVSRTAFLEALLLHKALNNKIIFVPYFMSFYHRPIFIRGQAYHIYYPTEDIREPFLYVAANSSTGKIHLNFGLRISCSSPVNQSFTLKIYGIGFLCFPQIDFEAPLTIPSYWAWFQHSPLNGVTRDGNESTESPDITTDEYFASIYPIAVDVASPRAIRYKIRSTSGGTSTIRVRRYFGYHQPSDNTLPWYYDEATYEIGETLQDVDVTGSDSHGKTSVIKVEIIPSE